MNKKQNKKFIKMMINKPTIIKKHLSELSVS